MNPNERSARANKDATVAPFEDYILSGLDRARSQARGGEEVGLICLAAPRAEMEDHLAAFRGFRMVFLPARHLADGSSWTIALAARHTHCTFRSLFDAAPCARGWFSYESVLRGELACWIQERLGLGMPPE